MHISKRSLLDRSRRKLSAWSLALVCVSVGLAANRTAAGDASLGVPGVRGGVVTTSEPLAAQAGARILREGGNAVDAAVAIMFALNVLEPESSGIGGGGFMMIHLATKKETFVVDSREKAPAAADPNMFLLASTPTDAFPFDIRSTSGIGVGVPGAVRGVALAVERWGAKSFAEVLAPAIELAENGFRASSRLEESVTNPRLQNELGNPAYDLARKVFLPGGVPVVEGDLLVQPDLAKTLKTLAARGPDAFYTGPIADAIVATQLNKRTVDDPADQAKLIGRMTTADLANYQPAIRTPVENDYRGFRIVSMPPPSSGGLAVIQILKLIERFPVADVSQGYGLGAQRTLNVMIEAMRLAFQDRAVWMGDDDFVDVPSTGLLNDDYIAIRSALIDPDARQPVVGPGDPRPYNAADAGKADEVKLAKVALSEQGGLNTTHFSVVDQYGNVVSYTNTVESAWGTGLMVPGWGFLLNNELTDFNSIPTLNPGPDNFNPGANDVAANKRPRSSMAPTMVFDDEKVLAAYGSPGGSSIINSVVNITMNLIDHRRTIQEAVDAPRISFSSGSTNGGTTLYEFGLSDDVISALTDLGHSFSAFEIGSVQAVVIEPDDKKQFGAADKRRIGGVVSVRRDEIDGGKDKDND